MSRTSNEVSYFLVSNLVVLTGYEVTAFVRDPAKLGEVEPHHVEVGDVLDAKRVSEAVQGKKGVIVVLGNRENLGPTTVLSDGLKNILQAMVEHGVKRITCCISCKLPGLQKYCPVSGHLLTTLRQLTGLGEVIRMWLYGHAFLFWERAKVPAIYQPITEDHERMLNLLKSCDREWIAILPPHIADRSVYPDHNTSQLR
ncbi:BLVRB [Cordylochernes scorpioides]|uniref:BLVRB n=1 Tax=Cordylochernes scorpioides TaxID=51811 RepID=A0ABY6K5D7_9ARAC|nr:BLVRB [Cordylochernes scorpioides]